MTQTSPKNGHNGSNNGVKASTKPDPSDLMHVTAPEEVEAELPSSKQIKAAAFDQPVILQQTSLWAKLVVAGIVGVTSMVLIWASVARIEEAVPATGKLEPKDKVQEIQAPVGGVVQELLVKDGQAVKRGQVLIRFDPSTAEAQQKSFQQIRNSLLQENQFYRSYITGQPTLSAGKPVAVPPEMLALLSNRIAIASENQLYRAQVYGSGGNFSAEQQARLAAGSAESQSRTSAAELEVAQLQQQLLQTEGQLTSARQSFAIDQRIVNDIRPLAEAGGIGRIQLLRQEQEVLTKQAEVDRLSQEKQRLDLAIAQARARLTNTVAVTSTDLLGKISDNDKQLASIDSQINRAIVDNERRVSEIDSQLSQAEVTLKYQELRAPIDGIVFDLKPKGTGFVANNSEPVLKIVPSENLVAKVDVTNQDIGFVSEGMLVDVRIDAFPFSEFGDVKGTLRQIGSDALPPDQIHPFYRFPVTVEMDQQMLTVRGKEIALKSGMAVTANIITRDRTVMSIFTDLFSKRMDSIKTVR